MRIDVGSGNIPREGYITVDFYDADALVKAPAWDLPYDDGSIEAINCSHVLEHLTPDETTKTLAEFRRVLEVGGMAEIEVPDFDWCCHTWGVSYGSDKVAAYTGIFGNGDGSPMAHKQGFDWEKLCGILTDAGFVVLTPDVIFSHGMQCLWVSAEKP